MSTLVYLHTTVQQNMHKSYIFAYIHACIFICIYVYIHTWYIYISEYRVYPTNKHDFYFFYLRQMFIIFSDALSIMKHICMSVYTHNTKNCVYVHVHHGIQKMKNLKHKGHWYTNFQHLPAYVSYNSNISVINHYL